MNKKLFEYAGVAASVVLIAFGIGAVIAGAAGRNTVRDNLAKEQIVGTPDMTPKAIAAEAKAAGLKNVDLPTCSVAGQAIDNGGRARCFAGYMRVHALEATGDQVYAEMARYTGKDGYFAENVAVFSIVMGIALLLTGIGLLVLTLGPLRSSVRRGSLAVNPS